MNAPSHFIQLADVPDKGQNKQNRQKRRQETENDRGRRLQFLVFKYPFHPERRCQRSKAPQDKWPRENTRQARTRTGIRCQAIAPPGAPIKVKYTCLYVNLYLLYDGQNVQLGAALARFPSVHFGATNAT